MDGQRGFSARGTGETGSDLTGRGPTLPPEDLRYALRAAERRHARTGDARDLGETLDDLDADTYTLLGDLVRSDAG
ncbi:MAG: hypothetical protein ACRDTE_29440 [Pseudonocardiaceae bacterium]